jgi:hypothetical protein
MTAEAISAHARCSVDANIAFLSALLREFPEWAIWLPKQGQWTAVRPPHALIPFPQATLLWVKAASARQLYTDLEWTERQLDAEIRRNTRRNNKVSDTS